MSEPSSSHALIDAFAARPAAPEVRGHCPSADELYEAAGGRLPEHRRLVVLDHVADCADCAVAWRLARELDPAARISRGWRSSWNTWSLAAAASVVLALSAMVVLREPAPLAPPAEYRDGGANPDVSPAPESQVPSQGLPTEAFRLRWSAGPPDATYTLRVTDSALAPVLVEQGLTEAEYLVPAEALDQVAPGATVLWQVEMRRPDGTGAVSPTYRTRVE